MMRRGGQLTVVWLAVWGALATAQTPDPPAPPLPQPFLADYIAALESQIADRTSRLVGAQVAERAMLGAERNMLMVARRLLVTGRDAGGDQGAVAIMYGLTVANHADQLHRVIEPLPGMVASALRGTNQSREVARLSKIVEAIKQFNTRSEAEGRIRLTADPASIDRYLQHVLSPLATVVTGMNQPVPADTWIHRSQTTPGERRGQVDVQDIDPLARRFAAVTIDEAMRRQVTRVLDLCRRGWAEADLRPFVAAFIVRMQEVAEVAEAIDAAAWLDQATRDSMRQQLRAAVVLLSDVRTRIAGERRLAPLVRLCVSMRRVTQMAGDAKVPVDRLQVLTTIAHHSSGSTSDALADVMDRLTQTMLTYRRMPQRVLPVDVRRTFAAAARQYERLEQQASDRLTGLAADPSTAGQWDETLGQLQRQATLAEQLNAVPEWIARMQLLNPVAGRGLYAQVRQITRELQQPDTEARAMAMLAELGKQLELFEELPHEKQLETARSGVARLAGIHAAAMSRQITLLRSQWAAAWGAGADPTEVGKRLLALRDLLGALHDATQVGEPAAAMAQLNRWAGWEIDTQALKPLNTWMPARLQLACQLAATGHWAQLSQVLEQIEQQDPVGRVVVYLSQALAGGLRDLPGGVSGMLGQCLYAPRVGAFGRSQRQALATLSVYLTAAEHARRHDQPETASQLMAYCGQVARGLLKQWEGERPRIAAPPTPAPDPPEPGGALDL
jgi:hypothetical protein